MHPAAHRDRPRQSHRSAPISKTQLSPRGYRKSGSSFERNRNMIRENVENHGNTGPSLQAQHQLPPKITQFMALVLLLYGSGFNARIHQLTAQYPTADDASHNDHHGDCPEPDGNAATGL